MASMVLSLVGCSSAEPSASAPEETVSNAQVNPDEPAWKSNTDDDRELTWYLNLSWFTAQWGEDWTSAYIKEKTGFNIVCSAPAGNEAERVNTMIASNTLPDIMTLGWYEPQVAEMIAADMLYPINELADQYDPYFYQVAKQDILQWNEQADGNVYGYNCFTTTASDLEESDEVYANRSFLVRKDLYEALGSPDMTTTEGFYNALKAAKEQFPTLSDGNPISPLGAMAFTDNGCDSFDAFLQDYLAIPYEVDGQFNDRRTDPEYLRWLKMFRQAYQDGLISTDVFTDKSEAIGDKLSQGRYFATFFQWIDMQVQQQIRHDADPEGIYIGVAGPKNSNGADPTLAAGSPNGWMTTMITKNCEEPDRAIQFFTYMISEEGMKDVTCGVPGKTYNDVDGKVVYTDEYLEILNSGNPENIKHGVSEYGYFQDDLVMLKNGWLQPTADYIQVMREWTKDYTYYTAAYELPALDPDSTEAMDSAELDLLWGRTLPQLLTAESEEQFDQIYEDYVARRDTMGYEAVMAAKTELMNQNKERLGIE
ncbi:MAG TPA: extracellular solute-binding protein [Candidatus Caccousia avistercoris]|nr:extracellular solute-binding protein [Candidatus Caccousia avistercoris]